MTPHELKAPENDHGMGRWTLMALQVLAMALCFCLLARMWMEYELELPHQLCVQAPTPVHPVTNFKPAE
jgi:hypothetical protein